MPNPEPPSRRQTDDTAHRISLDPSISLQRLNPSNMGYTTYGYGTVGASILTTYGLYLLLTGE